MSKGFFNSNVCLHLYQNTQNGFLLFYSTQDFLVFFTLFCTMARKYRIRVLGLCLMIDHIHALVQADSGKVLSSFVRHYASLFTKEMKRWGNAASFRHPFGWAPKSSEKALRTAMAYLYNNPVEKALVLRAEDYRWNFLSYARSDHPFSEPLVVRKSSYRMKKALQQVDGLFARGTYLNPLILRNLFKKLLPAEKRQLADHIVSRWSVIDYRTGLALYKSYEDMLSAFASNTGSEHEIRETRDSFSHRTYYKMNRIVREELHLENTRDVLSLDLDEKLAVARMLLSKSNASIQQICRFLHINRKM